MFVSSSGVSLIKKLGKLNYVIVIFMLWRLGYNLLKVEFYIYGIYFMLLTNYFINKTIKKNNSNPL